MGQAPSTNYNPGPPQNMGVGNSQPYFDPLHRSTESTTGAQGLAVPGRHSIQNLRASVDRHDDRSMGFRNIGMSTIENGSSGPGHLSRKNLQTDNVSGGFVMPGQHNQQIHTI